MSFLSNTQIKDLNIERFIFHVVQHGLKNPILLKETPIGKFKDFFIQRVKDTLEGNRFVFNPKSETLSFIKEIDSDISRFVPNSNQLAINFHKLQNRNIKPGVLIFIILKTGPDRIYSLIKYDHEEVLTYKIEGARAILEEITNSFTKSKESLHKSAVIKLNKSLSEVIVIDRKVKYDISDFFKTFLDVRRKYKKDDLTSKIYEVTKDIVKTYKEDLPKEITSNVTTKFHEVVNNLESFTDELFFNRMFGIPKNERIKKSYDTLLRKKDLEGEVFKLDTQGIPIPRIRKYETKEGVRIQYTEDASDKVDIKYGINNEPTTITIVTEKLTEL